MNTDFTSMSKVRQALTTPLHYGRCLGLGLLVATISLLLGITSCSKEDNSSPNNDITEQDLVGLWWDEFEYSDVTETGVPFSHVLLAVKADADHTGCIYLGVFDDISDEPVAIYGGPEDAGFTWKLLNGGNILIADPATGESEVLTRAGGNYGAIATDVSSTNLTYVQGKVTMTNESYSGTLVKANAGEADDIVKKLTIQSLTTDTNLGTGDDIDISDTPKDDWGR